MLIISVTQAPKKNNATPGKTPPNPTPTTTSSTTQAGKPGPAKPTPVNAPMGNLLSNLNCVKQKVIKFPTT